MIDDRLGDSLNVGAKRAASAATVSGQLMTIGVVIGLFVLALIPRAYATGAFVTVDEGLDWFRWSALFLDAFTRGDFAAMRFVGHPGVTTLWFGAVGETLHRALGAVGWIDPADVSVHHDFLRFPVAVATSACVAMAFLLLRSLLDWRIGLLAAIFWATDPFLVAHSQLLHVDALLASLATLALLAALAAFRVGAAPATERSEPASVRKAALVGSALAYGLALLTKAPALLALPFIGLTALIGGWSGGNNLATYLRAFRAMLVWGGIVVAVWIAFWPAAWVDLPGAVAGIIAEVHDNGGQPHEAGNFFLGRAVADPGALFYPIAIALRLTPWAAAGLLLSPFALIARRTTAGQRAVLLILLAFAVGFIALMSLPPKKFDRYALPIFPTLNVLAAAGWIWAIDQARRWIPRAGVRTTAILNSGAWISLIGLLGLNLAWYHPYELAYYNPLLGGGPTAARAIPVGWGEGLEQAAAYVVRQPDGCDRQVAAWFEELLGPYACPSVVPMNWAAYPDTRVGYVILYIDQIQRGNHPEVLALLNGRPPVHTVRIHGIDYAYVYQLPPPIDRRIAADFGPAIGLRGYAVDVGALRTTGVLALTLQWQSQAPITTDYQLFVHLLNADGQTVAQADVPPGGPEAPTSSWRVYHYQTRIQPIPTSADLPAGAYWLTLGVYDPQTFARLTLDGPPRPDAAPDDGPDALTLGPILIP